MNWPLTKNNKTYSNHLPKLTATFSPVISFHHDLYRQRGAEDFKGTGSAFTQETTASGKEKNPLLMSGAKESRWIWANRWCTKKKVWHICNITLFMPQELTSTQVSCMHHTWKAVCSNLCNNSVDKFFACEEEAASQQQQQQQIDSIDDQLNELTARKAELQNRLDNIGHAKKKNNDKGETVSPEERLTPLNSSLLTGFSSSLIEVSFTISQKIVPEVPAAVSNICIYVEPPPSCPGKIRFTWMPVKTDEFHIFCFIYRSCTTENNVWMLLRIFVQVLMSVFMMLKQSNYRTKWYLKIF